MDDLSRITELSLIYSFFAYLIGSIPSGYIFGKLRGIDIRQHGSGNIGATNVWRVMGKGWGTLTFAFDFSKVFLAAFIKDYSKSWLPLPPTPWEASLLDIFLLLGAVVGHNYPVWLKFKGGKGIATSAGGLLWLMPQAFLVVTITWIIVFSIFRYVSLASIVSAIVLPLSILALDPKNFLLLAFSSFLSGMAIWRHRANIERLMTGTEHQWKRNKKVKTSEGNHP